MTSTILPCPCPCPVAPAIPNSNDEQWLVETPDFWLEPGDRIKSPGGSFEYEVLSFPFCQLFLDYRGEFQSVGWRRVLNEVWESEEERAIAVGWLAYFRVGSSAFPPTQERLSHQVKFLVLWQLVQSGVLPASAIRAALAITGRLLPHKDNNHWVANERGRWGQRGVFPSSYRYRVVGCETPLVQTKTFYYNFQSVTRAAEVNYGKR